MNTIEANTTEKHTRAFWALQLTDVLLQLLQLLTDFYPIYLTLQ